LTVNLGEAINEARAVTDALFRVVRPDSLYERPIPERHRIIFYLGHLEAFDWNQVARGALGMKSFHPSFDKLFEFGIDPREGTLPDDTASDWPSVEEVESYNRRVRAELDGAVNNAPPQSLCIALEHRLMHAETFAYMLHNLPYERKIAEAAGHSAGGGTAAHRMIQIPAGAATLGRRREDGFGWDNEYDEHTVPVASFAIAKHKVTNGDYLDFVSAGARPPHFWVRRDGRWFCRGMFSDIDMPWEWPVYVTQNEAEAYASWKGMSLPTEAQFHRAAYGTPQGDERLYPWGDEKPHPSRGNFDFAGWDPAPVSATPEGDSAFGVSQMVGNGWEWTSTVFEPFSGFEPFPTYPGYSANFFDGEHFVMKGGSARTAAALLRRSFRNWFRPRYPYVYAGFRLVEN
jgi:formylglycine-generating enzyme required for sulfatase activity